MPQHWIRKLLESNSKLHKLDVITQALEAANLGAQDADEFLVLAWYAHNPYNVYNTKKVPLTEGIEENTGTIPDFIELLKALQAREFTGNAAIAELERMSLNYNSDLWNTLLRPVILKDLRVGATIKSFNKILKGTKYEVPVFSCQLAHHSEDHTKKMVGRKILEPKLDGVRALAVVDISLPETTKVQIFSRNGKPLRNFPLVEEQLSKVISRFTNSPWNDGRITKLVFDGEIISENFQALMKQAQRKTNVDTTTAVYSIFDVVPYDHFNKGKWNMAQEKRINEWLGSIKGRINESCVNLHVISGIEVDLDTSEGWDIMGRYAKDMVDMGYEGIMVKDVNAPYVCKKGTNWLKWKPTITVDLELVDMEEGSGKNVGRLGALVCEGVDEGRKIRVNVGGGLSDKQRDDFWARKDELLGFIVEVKADAVTQNQDGSYSLRFPRFVTFRGFEKGEKI